MTQISDNKFLQQAQEGHNHWWRYLATIGIMAVGGIVIMKLLNKVLMPIIKKGFAHAAAPVKAAIGDLLLMVMFGTILILLAFCIKRLHHRSFRTLINTGGLFSWNLFFKGMLLWLPILLLSTFVNRSTSYQVFMQQFSVVNFLLALTIALVTYTVQGLFEEVLFRGYLLQGMALRIKRLVPLVLLNSLLFGCMHIGGNLQYHISTFLFGIAFCVIALHQQRLEFAAGIHCINNVLFSVVLPNDGILKGNFDPTALVTDLLAFAVLLFIVKGKRFQPLWKRKLMPNVA